MEKIERLLIGAQGQLIEANNTLLEIYQLALNNDEIQSSELIELIHGYRDFVKEIHKTLAGK